MSKYSFDVKGMSVEDLRLKMMTLENEYNAKRDKIVSLVEDLKNLDRAYISCKNEINNRNVI